MAWIVDFVYYLGKLRYFINEPQIQTIISNWIESWIQTIYLNWIIFYSSQTQIIFNFDLMNSIWTTFF